MKKFLINTAAVCGLVLLMFVGVEFLLLTQTNIYSYKRQYVENHINEIEILFLGNSHIEEAVKPELVGKNAFNMAISGRPRQYDIELAKRYIPNMTNLKALIMPLDYTNFYLGRDEINPGEQKKANPNFVRGEKCMYSKYMGIRLDEFYYWSEILNSRTDFMMRFFRNEERNRGCEINGYVPLDIKKRIFNWQNRAMPKLIDTSKPVNTDKFNELKNWYLTLAELTKNRNARLILLGTPMYETYQKDLNPKVLEEISTFIEMLKKDYQNVEYYDFTFDKDFLPEDFNDASHLTDSGAEKFSKKLKEIVENR